MAWFASRLPPFHTAGRERGGFLFVILCISCNGYLAAAAAALSKQKGQRREGREECWVGPPSGLVQGACIAYQVHAAYLSISPSCPE